MICAAYPEVGGARGFVEIAGDPEAEPVLCIHSAGQSGVQWRDVLAELPPLGYRVIVPDLPGHGRAEPAPGGAVRDLGVYARWCEQLLDHLDIESAWVVGCSIGGKIALDLAAGESGMVRGAVAMAADARNGRLSVGGLERSLEDAASPSRGDRTWYGTLAACGRTVPRQRAELIAQMHRREDPVVSTADLIGWTTHDLAARLGGIDCPVRLVAGTDDFWLDVGDVEWTAAQIPACTYDVLEGVGHYPMEELAGFPALLAGWLADMRAHEEVAA